MILCGAGVVLGPIAVITGVISRKRGALAQQSSYGKATSTLRSWIGIVSGGIGTLVSIAFIVTQILHKR